MLNTKNNKLALKGIKVLDLTRLIPGAFCTSMLADAGAEVIKIEEPKIGDYERNIPPFSGEMASRFRILNRNKESLTLDLKQKEGKQIFLKLVESADVVIEGFRPGAMEKLGLDYGSLEKINSRLIYCSISSFGQDGPYRDVVAHDINILGMAGFFDVTGIKDGPPVIPGVQMVDSIAGTNAALSIMIALFARTNSNRGQFIDTSMFDGVISWLFDSARYVFTNNEVPARGAGRLNGGFPNYNLYETKDNKYLTIGSLETKFKNTLLEKLGRPDFINKNEAITSTYPSENDDEIEAFFKKTFLTKTRDEWVLELEGLNICVGPVNTVEEALEHPQTLSRKMIVKDNDSAAAPARQIGSLLPGSDPCRKPAPKLGEHSEKILAGMGYNKDEIDAFAKAGIIRQSDEKG